MAPIARGWVTAILDKYTGWSNGLPPETNSYTKSLIKIPIPSDNIELEADLYQPILPKGSKPVGTLLIRGPYGRSSDIARVVANLWVARGYQALYVSDRGTFGSGGEFRPVKDCARDGAEILKWMRAQDWYTGSFATLGPSYMGFEGYAMMDAPEGIPSDMACAVVNTGPHDFIDSIWGTGAFQPMMIFWAAFMEKMLKPTWEPILLWFLRLTRRVSTLYDAVPLKTAVDEYFGGKIPAWLEEVMDLTSIEDSQWDSLRITDVLDRARMPIFLTAGWYDIMRPQVFEQYARLSKHNPDVVMTVGPWTHLGAGGGNSLKETWAFLEEHLAKRTVSEQFKRSAPMRIHVTGGNEWRDLETWPPAQTKSQDFFLHEYGELLAQRPSSDGTGKSEFDYDPKSPTPATGMAVQFGISPVNDDTTLCMRKDVLTFTSPPLENPLEVFGQPTIELYHETSTPFADLLVRLSDVDSKGVSRNISEIYSHFDEKRQPGSLHLKLSDCGHCFVKGSRVRLVIAGGAHPIYLRNLGSGEHPATGTKLVTVKHTILHNFSSPSSFSLPVLTKEE